MSGNALDRSGVFKARPVQWKVKSFQSSRSVAIAIRFIVLSELQGSEWGDWTQYGQYEVWGDYFVVGKDGQANVKTVEQLALSMGWGGSLRQVAGAPPDVVVQISVSEETYQGKTYFRAGWMNPEDYVHTGGGADEQEVAQLDTQFGSLLRAAAGAVKKPGGPKPPAKPPARAPQAKPVTQSQSAEAAPAGEPPTDYGDIPF